MGSCATSRGERLSLSRRSCCVDVHGRRRVRTGPRFVWRTSWVASAGTRRDLRRVSCARNPFVLPRGKRQSTSRATDKETSEVSEGNRLVALRPKRVDPERGLGASAAETRGRTWRKVERGLRARRKYACDGEGRKKKVRMNGEEGGKANTCRRGGGGGKGGGYRSGDGHAG